MGLMLAVCRCFLYAGSLLFSFGKSEVGLRVVFVMLGDGSTDKLCTCLLQELCSLWMVSRFRILVLIRSLTHLSYSNYRDSYSI